VNGFISPIQVSRHLYLAFVQATVSISD
jgi:hypothetical protein